MFCSAQSIWRKLCMCVLFALSLFSIEHSAKHKTFYRSNTTLNATTCVCTMWHFDSYHKYSESWQNNKKPNTHHNEIVKSVCPFVFETTVFLRFWFVVFQCISLFFFIWNIESTRYFISETDFIENSIKRVNVPVIKKTLRNEHLKYFLYILLIGFVLVLHRRTIISRRLWLIYDRTWLALIWTHINRHRILMSYTFICQNRMQLKEDWYRFLYWTL